MGLMMPVVPVCTLNGGKTWGTTPDTFGREAMNISGVIADTATALIGITLVLFKK